MSTTELIEFVKAEKNEAEKALKFRMESEAVWRGGTNETWQKAGCKMTKAQRLETSAKELRIAIKVRRRVEMFDAVLNVLLAANG